MNNYHKADFMTLEEVAQTLHIAKATLRNKLSSGDDLPENFRVGRLRLFPRNSFYHWLEKKRLAKGNGGSCEN